MIFFALYAFLDDLKPSHLNLSIQIDPSNRDWISLSSPKHMPVFCCSFDSGTREITLRNQKGCFPYGNVQTK